MKKIYLKKIAFTTLIAIASINPLTANALNPMSQSGGVSCPGNNCAAGTNVFIVTYDMSASGSMVYNEYIPDISAPNASAETNTFNKLTIVGAATVFSTGFPIGNYTSWFTKIKFNPNPSNQHLAMMKSCERNALLAMSNPSKYKLTISWDASQWPSTDPMFFLNNGVGTSWLNSIPILAAPTTGGINIGSGYGNTMALYADGIMFGNPVCALVVK